MSYTAIGIIDAVFPEETVGNNGFKKRVLWIKTEEQYSQILEFQFTQQNTDLLDGLSPGEKVQINFNINGRKTDHPQHGERVFNSNVGFQIKRL